MTTIKTTAAELAILGGPPAFAEPLHVGRPNIGDRARLIERFNRILDSRWLTNDGPFVRDFEQRVAEMLGVGHCLAMCNGTVALEIAIRALGMAGEVIVPSFTFVATVHALQWQEITPVFGDIDPETHLLDPDCVERLITPRTTGIIGVHVWGNACAVDRLEPIARRHHLRLLYDAAHAFGCSHGGRMLGNFGDAEVFSFHATKFVNTFEGGAVTTNDGALASRMRLMRNFGFSGFYDQVDYLGTNGKLSEVAAAMGLTSLESLDAFVEVNRRNHARYAEELRGTPGLRLRRYDGGGQHNFQYIVVEVDQERFGLSRDELAAVLHAENVLARRYFYPGCHRMEPYRSRFPEAGRQLPVTERVCGRVLILPTGTAVGEEEIRAIGAIVRAAGAAPAVVRGRLKERT